ncbi:hypothetical protein BJ684DRAFT_17673 [Piptocephalis cylindrospora]|uniref:FHA domain-containing protein n=1 Tax=Piptocephalis cylindrospora TaxID=1907219 RepID=A0A4P9XZ65_9FUNG|nr:hypothetical protein BJ684DRAFT_17673 [Piptocephalis cylindrospora]|eukprot:RKP11763.1 hypothetical protein BJ684DRAFT_17673 [Piptocephalis cylindrospora]
MLFRLGFNFAMGPNNTFNPDADCDIIIHFTDQASDHHRTCDRDEMPRLPQAWLTDKTTHGIRLNGKRVLKHSQIPLRNEDEISLGATLYVFCQLHFTTENNIKNQDTFSEMCGPFIEVVDPTATRWCLTCLGLSSGPHVWQNGSAIMPAHSAVASAPESREEEISVSTERREEGRVEDGGRREEGRVEDGGRREEDGGRREEDGGRREEEEGREGGGRREEGRVEDCGRKEEGREGGANGGRRDDGREGGDTGTGGREDVVQVEPSESDRRSVHISLGKRSRDEEASATDELGMANPQREQGVTNDGDATGPYQEPPSNHPRRGATDDTVDVPRKVKKPRVSNSLPTRRSARLEAKTPRYQLRERGRPSTTKSNSVSAHMNEKVNDLEEGKGKRKRSPGGICEGMIKKRRSTTTKDSDPENKSSSKRKRSPGGVSGKATKKRRSTNTKDPAPESQEALQYSITNFTPPLRGQKGAKSQGGPLGGSILGSPNTPPVTDDPYQLSSPCPIPTTSSFIATKLHPSPATSPPRPPQLHRSTSAPPM